jgi:hypothetical protein
MPIHPNYRRSRPCELDLTDEPAEATEPQYLSIIGGIILLNFLAIALWM